MLGHRKASQIADHRKRMLINGINVKQIVLHLPNDTSKDRQIARQNIQHRHAS